MLVNPALSEKENILIHLNQITYDEMTLDELTFSIPKSIKEEPEVRHDNYREYDLNTINTEIIVSPANEGLDKWSGSKSLRYRRLHIGVQFRLCKRNLDFSVEDRHVIRTRYRIRNENDERIGNEIKRVLAKVGLKVDSIHYEILNVRFDEYLGYPTVGVRITPIENSLIYVGEMTFELEIAPEIISLPGFKPYRE